MRVPVEWLSDYVDLDLSTHDLAATMTMRGLKVEAVERIGEGWDDVVVGEVVQLEPHPRSNKPLHVAVVDIGGRTITVVTGAQNLSLHDRAPVVLVGGTLPHGPDGAPIQIGARPMAGITSEGMLASARELGIADEHSGIYILPPDAPVGANLRSVLGGDVLDIETHPNRPDTLSLIGVAREVAAMTEQQITPPDTAVVDSNVEWVDEESIRVEIEDPELCARYTAWRIEGVEDRPSPVWMANKLEAAGMRPINLLVDITNYVMLEFGQPMHAFDAAQLEGGAIVVRRAHPGERLRTLDGIDRELDPTMLVIADGVRAVGLAGIIGGENSEIGPDTTCLILESATFSGTNVRRTAKLLGLRTEASARFEKALPSEQAELAARRYVQLLSQLTTGTLRVYRMTDVWPRRPERRRVTMPMRDLHRLTGLPISADTAVEKLSLLGFGVEEAAETVIAEVPYWRRADIAISADLVEEVVRLVGYERVPSTLPRRTMPPPPALPDVHWRDVIRGRLLAAGVSEAVTGTLTSRPAVDRLFAAEPETPSWERIIVNAAGVYAAEALTEPIILLNPPTQDRDVVRPTLLPGLLDVCARNLKHTDEGTAFFEMAPTFFPRDGRLPFERRTLGIVLTGMRRPASWQEPKPGSYTFFDMKGILEAILDDFHVPDWTWERADNPALHPGRAAALRLDGREAAVFGELHPLVARAFDIESWSVQVAEVDLGVLVDAASDARVFRPLPRYPAAYRDIAVLIPEELPAERILRVVQDAGEGVVESARIFDVYSGNPLPVGAKSVAVGMQLRAPGATLTAEDIESTMERIISALREKLGASLRE